MKSRKSIGRVAIIGCNNFSAANLYSLLMNGTVAELVLIDEECEKLLGEISHLQKTIPLNFPVRVFQGEFEDAKEAKIAVIASGTNGNPSESPLDSLGKNVEIVGAIAGKLKENNFNGVILVTTNPVDILANIALEKSGLPANKVIGSGKTLDKELFQKILENESKFIQSKSENAEIATWCAAITAAATFIDHCQPNCSEFEKMLDADKKKPVQITHRKDFSLFAVGSCVARICEAILRDERTILPILAMTSGQYGISGVYMNLPCIIRREGVEDVINLKINQEEKAELIESSVIVKRTFSKLKKTKKFIPAKII